MRRSGSTYPSPMNANAAGRKTSRATASAGNHERRSAASSADAGAAAVPEHTYHHGNLHETLVLRGIEIPAENPTRANIRYLGRDSPTLTFARPRRSLSSCDGGFTLGQLDTG